MAQQRARIIGLPGGGRTQRSRGAAPMVDWQNVRLPLDSLTAQQLAQYLYEQLLAHQPSVPDTAGAAQEQAPPQSSPVESPASTTTASSPALRTPSRAGVVPPVPPLTSANASRGILAQQMELARMGQQLQALEMGGAAQPVEVGEPIGEDVARQLAEIPRYDIASIIENYFGEPRQQSYPLWASVPAGSPRELISLVREYTTTAGIHDPVFSSESNLRDALIQKARQLLDAELQSARVPIDQQYQNVLEILKRQEAELVQQLRAIPPEQRVRANPHFVDLYNRYLKLQGDILNTALIAAANRNYRVNWDNLLGRAVYELARPVLDHIQRSAQLVQPHSNWIESARRALQQRYADSRDERLREAIALLDSLEQYTGRINLRDALQARQLYERYESLLQSAGLDPREYRVATPLGELPGIGYSGGPIIEPVAPLVATLAPAALTTAQPGKVEVPMPTTGGSGGGRLTEKPLPIRVRALWGVQEYPMDINRFREELSKSQIAGLVYIPLAEVSTWRTVARKISGNDSPTPRIKVGGIEFQIGRDDYTTHAKKLEGFVQEQLSREGVANKVTKLMRQHLGFIMSSSQLPDEVNEALQALNQMLEARFSDVSLALRRAAQGRVNTLYSEFVNNLLGSEGVRRKYEKALQEARQAGTTVQDALRAAVIGAISEHMGQTYRVIGVNGKEIDDDVIRPGILRMLFNGLAEIVH